MAGRTQLRINQRSKLAYLKLNEMDVQKFNIDAIVSLLLHQQINTNRQTHMHTEITTQGLYHQQTHNTLTSKPTHKPCKASRLKHKNHTKHPNADTQTGLKKRMIRFALAKKT